MLHCCLCCCVIGQVAVVLLFRCSESLHKLPHCSIRVFEVHVRLTISFIFFTNTIAANILVIIIWVHTRFWILIWWLTVLEGYSLLIAASLQLFELRLVFQKLRLELRLEKVTWFHACMHYFRGNCANLEGSLNCIIVYERPTSNEAHRYLAVDSRKVIFFSYFLYLTLEVLVVV